jgi:hypothetical protein
MAEMKLRIQAGTDPSWIGQSIDAACRRLQGIKRGPQLLSAVYVPDGGRLSCIVSAANQDDVVRLLEIALLPSARVMEVMVVRAITSEEDLD